MDTLSSNRRVPGSACPDSSLGLRHLSSGGHGQILHFTLGVVCFFLYYSGYVDDVDEDGDAVHADSFVWFML